MTALPLLLAALLLSLAWQGRAFDNAQFVKDYPAAFTPHNRVMGLVLAFNLEHIDPLILIVNEYLSMCEAGWDPTITIFTVVDWSAQLRRLFRQKVFCYRTGQPVPIVTRVHDKSIGTGLAAEHRAYMSTVLSDYDVFIYHEDDIVVKLNHLVGYLNETRVLHDLAPESSRPLSDNLIGFQRFRRIFKMDGHAAYGEQDVIEQELLEEMPDFVPICLAQKPYLLVKGNIHQAMWVLTRQQVLHLQEKCAFLNQSSPSREYMSSFSLFSHQQYHCYMDKLLPAERLMTFGVLHYYQQRHISWTPIFLADENIRAGFNYHFVPKTEMNVPECWRTMAHNFRVEQDRPTAPASH